MLLSWTLVLGRLRRQHGQVGGAELPLGNKREPFDELSYICPTLMTRPKPRIDRAYEGLLALCRGA